MRRIARQPVVRAAALVALLGLALALTGCDSVSSPQNTFAPKGEVAEDQRNLFILVAIPALIILILVEGLIIVAVLKYRHRGDGGPLPKQVHGNTKLELAWTIAPALLLIGIAVPTIDQIIDLSDTPASAMHMKVTGRQWAWEFEYSDISDGNGQPLTSIEELHIPVGQVIAFDVLAEDVIHSFWVPKLAGKQDAVPGRKNHLWIKAEEPGEYSGQCAEFCGTGHSAMRLRVIVQTQEDFDAWVNEQGGTARAAAAGN